MQRKGASGGLPNSAFSHHKIFLSWTDGVQNCNRHIRMCRQLQKRDAGCLPPTLYVHGLCGIRFGACFVFLWWGLCLTLLDPETNMS